MTSRDRILKTLDRPISFHRAFVGLGIGVTGAVMLSQMIYWTRRTAARDGWFYKTQDEWEEETGLTRREQDTARRKMREIGILEEARQGVPARLFYRLDLASLEGLIERNTSLAESAKLDWRKAPDKSGGKRQTNTETTTETTTYPLNPPEGEGDIEDIEQEPLSVNLAEQPEPGPTPVKAKTGSASEKAEEFEEFWKAFPPGRKYDKPKARALFLQIVSGKKKSLPKATADVLIAAARRYAATNPDPQYTPMPTTWLNGARWEADQGGAAPPDDRDRERAKKLQQWDAITRRYEARGGAVSTATELTPPPHIRADAEKPDRAARAEWIVAMSAEGHKVTDIAKALGVTRQTVYNAIDSGGVIGRSGRPRKDRKPGYEAKPRVRAVLRPCMTCGKRFASEGPHNRMCSLCRRRGDPFSAR